MPWLTRKVSDLPPGVGKKLSWIAVLYFAEGFPFGIAYDIWPVYFRRHGVELREIGLMALLFLPYTLKPAWAPFVDRFGSRQAWIAGCQLALAGVCLTMLVLDPTRTDWVLWTVLLSLTVFSATQDIAIDAYAVDVATPKDSGHINGIRVSAYRFALLFGGGGLVLMADRAWFGWRGVWWVSAGICILFATLSFLSPRVARERAGQRERIAPEVAPEFASESAPEWAPDFAPVSGRLRVLRASFVMATVVLGFQASQTGWSGLWLTLTVIAGTVALVSFLEAELLRWLLTPEMVAVVAFILLYKVGDSTLGRMVKPFWVDCGMTNTDIGLVSTGLGSWLTIVGALLGGWFVARRGIFQALLWMGLAQLVSNFGYVAVAVLDLPRGDLSFLGLTFGPFQASLYGASILESITQGLGTAAFLSFLMNICDRTHAATQYALLTAAFSLSRDVAGAFSGIGVEALGYPLYFTITACLAVPALLLLPWIKGRIKEQAPG